MKKFILEGFGYEAVNGTFKFHTDPLRKYPDMDEEWFLMNIGSVPTLLDRALSVDDKPLAESMLRAYGGGSPLQGGTVLADGVYSYPQDPLIYPLAHCSIDRGDIYVYPYGIVCVAEDEKEPVVYRFD